MKKWMSKLLVLFLSFLIMILTGCTEEVRYITKEDSSMESSSDPTITAEAETVGNQVQSDSDVISDTDAADSTDATGNNQPTVTQEQQTSAEPTASTELPELTEGLENTEPVTASDLETIRETVLFDRDGVRVTAKELITDFWGKGISVLIENKTDKNIGIMSNTFIVNNYMCMNFTFSSVAPNSESIDTIPLNLTDISVKGIDIISEVAVTFLVFDNDSGDNLFVTDEATILTSAFRTVEQPAMPDGKELINQNGVQIIGKYVDENSSWGKGVLLYIKNDTDKDLLFQCEYMLINDISIYPFFSCPVNKGREALEAIAFMDTDLSDNNITEIKNIKLTFSGYDPATNTFVYAYAPVEITVGE